MRGTRRVETRSVLAALLLVGSGCIQRPMEPDGELPGDPLSAPRDTSLYVMMDDGVRIALDVHVPARPSADSKVPTLLEMTRYWRAPRERVPSNVARALERGFAYVIMDERGTGASFGSWPWALTERALTDGEQVLDWITAQPWSNGRVGATGISYPGMASQQLATRGHPALLAIAPRSDMWDLYPDLLFPGGIPNDYFVTTWGDLTAELDRSASLEYDGESFVLRPVDADRGGVLLAQAVAGHAGNMVVADALEPVVFRDDALGGTAVTVDDMSTSYRATKSGGPTVAVFHWGTWLDGASADGVIRQFMRTPGGPQRAVIGAWTHNLEDSASPYDPPGTPADPTIDAQWDDILDFFTELLADGSPAAGRSLRYAVLGTDEWRTTDTWPVAGTTMHRLYFGETGTLSSDPPQVEGGFDEYTVDFTAASSPESRWQGPLTGGERYPDRSGEDAKLVTYETPPLAADVEITGYATAHLEVTSTEAEGAFIVYLEDVAPDGTVRYVTEGELNALSRRVEDDPSPSAGPGPYHSYRSADALPLVPGEVAELDITLQPTAVRIREGHRIRVAVAGHDASALRRLPASGAPLIRLHRGADRPSYVEIPVVGSG